MAELIGVASGVIGIVLPAIDQIEKLIDRCQNFRTAPGEFHDLKSDCKAVSDSLRSLETNLQSLQQNEAVTPEDIQRFKSDADSVKSNFERAQERCLSVEKYFPNPGPDSSSCRGYLLHLRQALLRFCFAGRIAREFEDISRTVRDANADDTALNRFLHITIHIEGVKNEVRHVGVGVTAVNKKADTIEKEVKHVGVDVTTINKKTDTIEEEVKLVGVSVTTVDKKVDTLLQRSKEGVTDANDHFKANYFVPALSRTIILDFSTCDAEDVPITMEGKLKRALLDIDSHSEFSHVAVAVGAGGMGGVGKTNALRGVGWNVEVRERFKNGGIYFLSFGKDAGVGHVIEQLALAVEVSGGARRAREIRESKTLGGAIEIRMSWFGERETLFLCDDIWETAHSNIGYFEELKQLLTSRGRSRMVLSTRNKFIADAAGIPIEFGPRDPEGDLSRAILLKYAEISEEDLTGSCEKCQEAIGNILRTCGGIPLTLGVAGRAVRTEARNCDGGLQTAIVMYAEELETSTRKIITGDIEAYPNFCATVRASLNMVDRWAQKEGICGERGEPLICSDLFTRMNVFPRQSRIPQSVVKKLWGDVDDYDADRVIDKLDDLNLLRKRDDGASVGLHDLVLEYCMIQGRRDPRRFHCDFLDRYLAASKHLKAESATVSESALDKWLTTLKPRAWWSVSHDGYFPENVCRHLWKGGCVVELIALLCDVRWTTFRMRCGGLLGWKSDFESLTSAVSELKKENGSEDWLKMVESGLGLVREAVNEAWGYLKGNERELGMQVHSRLFDVDEEVWPVSRYLRSVRAHCEKPWLVPLGRYWARPGTGASVELLTGVDVWSIAMTNDGSVAAVGVGKEVLVMDVESKSILWRLAGHEKDVRCVCISGDGGMIVSGSEDGTLRRWYGRSGAPMGEPLRGHDDKVRCVAMSGDGAMIVSGSDDRALRRWNGRSGEPMGEPLCGHNDKVSCVAMSGDGVMIVSGSWDGTLCRWDGRSGAPMGEPLRGHDDKVRCVAMSGDGAMIVSGSDDRALRRWNGRSGAPMGEPLRGHNDKVSCVAMSGDGVMIVSGSWDGTLRPWDGRSGAAVGEPMLGHYAFAYCVAMSGDGAMILSGSLNDTLRRWDGRSGAAVGEPLRRHHGEVSCVAMSLDGAIVVSGSLDGTLCRWDGRSGAAVGEPLRVHDRLVLCVAMSLDGAIIVSGSYETVQLWDALTGAAIGPPVLSPTLNGVEIENDFVFGRSQDGEFTRWRIDKTCGLVDEEKWEPSAGWSEDADHSGGSDASPSWVLRGRSHQLMWDGPTGVHVLATLPAAVHDFFFKRVSFRAGGIGDDDIVSSHTVGAVVAVGLRNGMVCIFHLVTE